MFIRYLLIIFTVMLLTAPSVTAEQRSGLPEIMATLQKGYASMDDLHAGFSQRTYVAALKREEKGSGELFLKKRGESAMFRFNYIKPKQQIISNGKSVWYYLPENRQVIMTDTTRLFAGGNAMALSYLTGLGSLETDFTVRLLDVSPDDKGSYLLELVPKKQNAAVARLQLAISAAAVDRSKTSGYNEPFFPITASILFDQLGNRTTIEYSRVKVNTGLSGDRFTFKVPTGVDVIRQ